MGLSWRQRAERAKPEYRLYVERSKALEQLCLSLTDFRRLCIYKGVFPRVPKKPTSGPDKIYYFRKDISYLRSDPALAVMWRQATYRKKFMKAKGLRDFAKARRLKEVLPQIDMSFILKQRYPSFSHALEDLDDALSCVALFAALPSRRLPTDCPVSELGVTPDQTATCQKLMDNWYLLIGKMGMLNKGFISIKGYYYEAHVLGKKIIWLQPHEFATEINEDEIDVAVLKAFLDLYIKLLDFVMFKLYKLLGYAYPPQHTSSPPRRHLTLKLEATDEVDNAATPIAATHEEAVKRRTLFANQVFYVSRETPYWQLIFVLRACGAKIIGYDESLAKPEDATSPIKVEDSSITHHIADRPESVMNKWIQSNLDSETATTRTFLQPQWVFDCLNTCAVLPASPYRVGVTPPPHLSPFENDDNVQGDYVPEQRKILNQWAGKETGAITDAPVQAIKIGDDDHAFEEVEAIVTDHLTKLNKGVPPKVIRPPGDHAEQTEPVAPLDSKLREIKAKKASKTKELERERGKVALNSRKRREYKQVKEQEDEKLKEVAKLKAKASKNKKK